MTVFCFSVIIPCYQDEEKLASLLEQLRNLPHTPYEIIVVDGAQSEVCQEICTHHRVRWLPSSPCRGAQMLSGAALAKGNVLWFLHADAILPSDPLMAMTYVLSRGSIGGYFFFKFDTSVTWPACVLEYAIALRCYFGVPYGDQGIFVLQQIYNLTGGHAPWPLFEEVPLIHKIRQLGHFASLNMPIFVNPQRWENEGWWRRSWNNRKLALKFMRGIAPEQLASHYYSGARF